LPSRSGFLFTYQFKLWGSIGSSTCTVAVGTFRFFIYSLVIQDKISDGEHHYVLEIDKPLIKIYVKHNCFSYYLLYARLHVSTYSSGLIITGKVGRNM